VGIEGITLEHHGHIPACRPQAAHGLLADPDLSRAGLIQTRQKAQQGAFATAGGPDKHQEFTVLNAEIKLTNDLDRLVPPSSGKGFAQSFETDSSQPKNCIGLSLGWRDRPPGGAVQFIDQARITVRGGRGGDGIAAFRREKYVPAGGPSGGDGGHGGHVVLQADSNLQTLLDFKYKRLFAADDGRRGGPNKCTGASGSQLVVKVPCGTEARHLTTGILLGDLIEPGQQLTVAFGGRGGLGNAHYLSNRNRAPEKFTEGRDGEEWPLQLELKLLAEVGIIGLPNAGKSTLIAVLSAARPKIADYPFTTLIPNLGVVRRPSGDGTVFADIPGLIAGAAQGAGLGHDFLRHIERTRLLIHLVDAGAEDPVGDLRVVEKELIAYGHGLVDRPRLLVLNKQELASEDQLQRVVAELEAISGRDPLTISAVMGRGLDSLLGRVWSTLGV
jgi:GTP-binding protein